MSAPAHQGETSATDNTPALKAAAHRLGFTLIGICPAVTPAGVSRLAEWLDRGYAGQMGYMASRQQAYEHPRHVLEGTRSVMMLGLPYATTDARTAHSGQGRISRYAWGTG